MDDIYDVSDFTVLGPLDTDAPLTLTQSNQMLSAKVMGLSVAARCLLWYLQYCVNQLTPSILNKKGVEFWSSSENRLVDYAVDLTDFFNIPSIKERFAPRGIKNVFDDAADELVGTSLTLIAEDGSEKTITTFISEVKIDLHGSNRCVFSINREVVSLLVPELIALGEERESHKLSIAQTIKFASKYAEKLYVYINGKIQRREFLNSIDRTVKCPIQLLKSIFGLGENEFYGQNARFIQKILVPAVEEVCRVSDIRMDFETERSGRYIKWIVFKNIRRLSNDVEVVQEVAEKDAGEEIINDEVGIDVKQRFVSMAEAEGFSVTQTMELFFQFDGSLERFNKAKEAYRIVSELGFVAIDDKLNFFKSVK